MSQDRILVIEDDTVIRSNIAELLTEEGFEVLTADCGSDGIALAKGREPDLIICDIMMPGVDGYGVLRAVRDYASTSRVPFIFLTAKAERADIRMGMNLGADDYLTKPFTRVELLEAVRIRLKRAEEIGVRAAQERETRSAKPSSPELDGAGAIVVKDRIMRALYEQAARAAGSNINILILGETGVGKEILARSVHNLSQRKAGPFLALNCAALTESLLESELFGHEKGVFTGALQARAGLLESASGGTVFLDEVGDLPLPIQTKLLRVLEDRKVMRVGARVARSVDVRFVAATNKDLETASERGAFRSDLFYRLNGISFTIPPLR
ncbi:MAG TPA: sigma-54 dependent transcriptional regulator, partial [Polyangiaceae bacterium]|nr:sigma-54 dependent transcriptional regulator [Polyangiaceae bacterium]